MSRSDHVEIENPFVASITWNAKTGKFKLYNKITKTTTELPPKIKFIVLDTFQTIGGYNKPANAGYYSNWCRSFEPGFYTVRLYQPEKVIHGLPITGFWKDIKTEECLKGAAWMQVIAAIMKSNAGYQLVYFQLKSGAMTSYRTIKNPLKEQIVVNGVDKDDNDNFYFKCTQEPISDDPDEVAKVEEIATHYDHILQEYITAKFKQYNAEPIISPQKEEEDPDPVTEAKIFADKAIKSKQTEFNPELEIDENDLTDDDPGDLPF